MSSPKRGFATRSTTSIVFMSAAKAARWFRFGRSLRRISFRRREGKPILEAAVEGARLRFRPVMMTSFAFIFGLLPLVIATGAGALSRRAVGTPVFGGMIAASLVGIFVIPVLYVTFQWLRERSGRRAPRAKAPAGTD